MSQSDWHDEFRMRMHGFRGMRPHDGHAVSIKIRVVGGAFEPPSSPQAFEMIYQLADKLPDNVEYVPHESGPELLIYVASGVALTTSVINLVVAILKARSDGIKKGDKFKDDLELIVRRVDARDRFEEEIVLRIAHTDKVEPKKIRELLNAAVKKLSK
jgi:hypothetical protein